MCGEFYGEVFGEVVGGLGDHAPNGGFIVWAAAKRCVPDTRWIDKKFVMQ